MERWGFYELDHDDILGGAIPLRLDDIVILKCFGIKGIVDLTENESLLYEEYRKEGIDYLHLPTPDLASSNIESIQKFLIFYEDHHRIYIHCQVGEGRTGMFLSCFLIYKYQMDAQEAIKTVRRRRPNSVHTREQEKLIYKFARFKNQVAQYDKYMTRTDFLRPPIDMSLAQKYEEPHFGDILSLKFNFEEKIFDFSNLSSKIHKGLTLHLDYREDIFKIYAYKVLMEKVFKVLDIFNLNTHHEVQCKVILEYKGKIGGWNDPRKDVTIKREVIGLLEGIRLYEDKYNLRKIPFSQDEMIEYKDIFHPPKVKTKYLNITMLVKIKNDSVISKKITS